MRMLYVEEVYLISELGKIIIIIFINLCWVFSVYEHALDALFPPVLINKYPERGKREWKARNMQRQRDAYDGRQIDERQLKRHVMPCCDIQQLNYSSWQERESPHSE